MILTLCSSHVALAYAPTNGSHVIYLDQDPSEFEIRSMDLPNGSGQTALLCDEDGLSTYLSELTLTQITGVYEFPDFERTLYLYMSRGAVRQTVTVKDQMLILTPIGKNDRRESFYRIENPVDWEYLESLMEYGPRLFLSYETTKGSQDTVATLYRLTKYTDGQSSVLRQNKEPAGVSSLFDGTSDGIRLAFSHRLHEPYTVTIENWDQTEKSVIPQDSLPAENLAPVPYPHVRYTVNARLEADDGSLYEAKFRFECYDFMQEE